MTKQKNFSIKFLLVILFSVTGFSQLFGSDIRIHKDYEFGPGATYQHSAYRTFAIPSGWVVQANVSFQHDGFGYTPELDADVVLEIHSPSNNSDEVGPLVRSRDVRATNTTQSLSLAGGRSDQGCGTPWVVRVKTKSGDAPKKRVFGTITMVYGEKLDFPLVIPGVSGLYKNMSTTENLGNTQGFAEGKFSASGIWDDLDTGAFLPRKLKFELINPSGTVVAQATGYRRGEINPCCSNQILNLKTTITKWKPGQWKLRVTNLEDHIVNFRQVDAILTPHCSP